MSTDTSTWGEIQGQTITFPMVVPDLDAATLMFTVPLAAAQRLLPGSDFEVIDIGGESAQLVIALVDYIDNPWGDYLEINLGFLARPAGAPDDVVGSFIYRMPVDQEFTCEAGNKVMGFPKTVEDLSRTEAGGRTTFAMAAAGDLQTVASDLNRIDPVFPLRRDRLHPIKEPDIHIEMGKLRRGEGGEPRVVGRRPDRRLRDGVDQRDRSSHETAAATESAVAFSHDERPDHRSSADFRNPGVGVGGPQAVSRFRHPTRGRVEYRFFLFRGQRGRLGHGEGGGGFVRLRVRCHWLCSFFR